MKSILFLFYLAILFFASSCDSESGDPGIITADGGDSDTNDDQETELPEVTTEQEDDLCGDLSSSTGKFISAGSEMGDGQVINPGSGGFLVQLVDQGDFGGFVEIAGVEEDILLMLFKEDVPVTVLESSGGELSGVEINAGSGSCAEASGAYLWKVEGAPNYLEIGPTSVEEVHISLEKLE